MATGTQVGRVRAGTSAAACAAPAAKRAALRAKKGLGLFSLVGMVVSSCVGTGVFAITGQLAEVASPGAIVIAWVVVGFGFLMLALCLNNLAARRPDLEGIFSYATEGFGQFAGFLSGWGYWLSAWLGNVAFATMIMSTLGFFLPAFQGGNTLPSIVVASAVTWALTFLVIRGVENASFLNAVVMLCKVVGLGVFFVFATFLFSMNVFTADFWGTLHDNAAAMGGGGVEFGSIPQQVSNCALMMMWMFIGIEGASVMSARAEKKRSVGTATIVGLVGLLAIYSAASLLPYGYLPYTEIAQFEYPAMLYVFEQMAPGWGGAFIAGVIIVSASGAWLSFVILPSETTSDMADQRLLPAPWGARNRFGAPRRSLIVVAVCTQVFLLTLLFSDDAYLFATSMCTVTIVVTWTLAAAYQMKLSWQQRAAGQFVIGALAVLFRVVFTVLGGMQYLLLACIGYLPGFVVYARARKQQGLALEKREIAIMGAVASAAAVAVGLLATGAIVV